MLMRLLRQIGWLGRYRLVVLLMRLLLQLLLLMLLLLML